MIKGQIQGDYGTNQSKENPWRKHNEFE